MDSYAPFFKKIAQSRKIECSVKNNAILHKEICAVSGSGFRKRILRAFGAKGFCVAIT